MQEGPFGFPRLTNIGPFVSETIMVEGSLEDALEELMFRGHSLRNYDPREFRNLYERGASKRRLRQELQRIEDGRFNDMLKEAHWMFSALDEDEQEGFARNNPGLIEWMNVWALLEDQKQYPEMEDVGGLF